MESKLAQTNDEELTSSQHTGHNEDENLGEEKKSVFRRFKDKARKLKNTITKHGQADHRDDESQNDDDDDEEEEEEDETVEEDPDVHAKPTYDSALGGPDPAVAQPKDNLERLSVIAEDRATKPVASHDPPQTVPAGAYGTNLSEQSELGDQEVDPEKWKSKVEQPTGMEEEVTFDPSPTRAPPPVTEHTYGGKEAGLSQEQHSFDKMGIQDSGSERKRFDPEHPDNLPRNTLAGNQATQGSSYTEKQSSIATLLSRLGLGSGTDTANDKTEVSNPGGKEAGLSQPQNSFDKMSIHDSGSERPENLPRDTLAGNESTQGSNYSEKISSIASPLSGLGLGSGSDPTNEETKVTNPTHTGGKEAGLSQVQHSFDKMDIHDSGSEGPEHPENLPGDSLAGNESTQGSNYTEKQSSIATPLSGLGLGSGTDTANNKTEVSNPGGKEAGLSQAQHSFDKTGIYDSGSERPENPENLPLDTLTGNESTQGSNYTEKISSMATPLSGLGLGSDPANDETKVTNPAHTEGKEAGLSQAQHSFDRMGIHDSGSERPENLESLPRDTLAGNESTQGSNYTENISSIATPLSGLGLGSGSGSGSDPANNETKVTNPTHTGGEEAGLSQAQHSFDKMGIHDSGSERPENPEKLPRDTLAGNESTQGNNYTEKISSTATPLSGLGMDSGSDSANDETKVTNPTQTGGKEAGLSQVQHSFDKMDIHDSTPERKRFDPEHPDNLPRNTLAGNQATQGGSYTGMMSSMASTIASTFGYGEKPATPESHENVKNSGSATTDQGHSLTDKVTETSAPVNEKVPDDGSSVMSKVQGTSGSGEQ